MMVFGLYQLTLCMTDLKLYDLNVNISFLQLKYLRTNVYLQYSPRIPEMYIQVLVHHLL